MKAACGIRLTLLAAACAVTLAPAQGDGGLPLSIENLIAPAGGSELSYSIRHTAYGSETADNLGAEFGYSYGLTEKIEIGLSLTGSYTDNRNADPFRDLFSDRRVRDEKNTITRLGTLTAEISRSLSPEGETPGAFGWIGINLLENRATEGEDFEPVSGAFNAGLSLYRTYDPIVLRVAFGYVHRPEEPTRAGLLDRGDTISVSPSVSFAVNNVVSVSATMSVQVTRSDTLDWLDSCYGCSPRRTNVSTGLGVNLSLRDRTTIYISGSTFASSAGGASLGVFVRHRLQRRNLLADLTGEGEQPAESSTGADWGKWWDRHRVKVWGIASGLIAAARVRDARR